MGAVCGWDEREKKNYPYLDAFFVLFILMCLFRERFFLVLFFFFFLSLKYMKFTFSL